MNPIQEATKRIEPDVNTSYGAAALKTPKRNDVDYAQYSEDGNHDPISATEQNTRIVTTHIKDDQIIP